MEKEFKLFYFVLLAGNCKIDTINNGKYQMEYRITDQDRITSGRIKFNLNGEFKITEGLGTFMWFISKYYCR